MAGTVRRAPSHTTVHPAGVHWSLAILGEEQIQLLRSISSQITGQEEGFIPALPARDSLKLAERRGAGMNPFSRPVIF